MTGTMSPARPSARRLTGPVVTGVAGAAAVGLLYAVDPSQRTLLPCPLHQATGWWCSGCGLTRATHALVHLDLSAAVGYNLFAPLVLAVMVASWAGWLRTSLGFRPSRWPSRLPPVTWVALGVAVAAFTIARNTDRFAYLAP